MMACPNNLFHTMADTDQTLLLKLMQNVYEYGRAHWTWIYSTSPEGRKTFDPGSQSIVDELPAGPMGRGLLDGVITSAACGGFAAAFAGIANQIFKLKVECGNERTAIQGSFITLPNTWAIDSRWRGNVWMDVFVGNPQANKLFNRFLRAFEFGSHYFCYYKGEIYDVTSNRKFTNTSAMIWCKLTADDSLKANYPGAGAVFRTVEVTRHLYPLPRFLVRTNREPSLASGFANGFLTDRESIPQQEMQIMSSWSSRA